MQVPGDGVGAQGAAHDAAQEAGQAPGSVVRVQSRPPAMGAKFETPRRTVKPFSELEVETLVDVRRTALLIAMLGRCCPWIALVLDHIALGLKWECRPQRQTSCRVRAECRPACLRAGTRWDAALLSC